MEKCAVSKQATSEQTQRTHLQAMPLLQLAKLRQQVPAWENSSSESRRALRNADEGKFFAANKLKISARRVIR